MEAWPEIGVPVNRKNDLGYLVIYLVVYRKEGLGGRS